MNSSERVLVAMSGGVDSAIAAFLLKKQGYNLTGLTISFNDESSEKNIKNALKICEQLNIPHEVLDCRATLEEKVISYFIKEYQQSRTPNPCIVCNKYIKFGILLEYVKRHEYQYLALGHYAKIVRKGNNTYLCSAKDPIKDQSYFLYQVFNTAFRKVIFPLSFLNKREVLKLAEENNLLPLARESYSACFMKDEKLYDYLQKQVDTFSPGNIYDRKGALIGQHKGAVFYTVGQRSGLQIKKSVPLYVLDVNVAENSLCVGERKYLRAKWLVASSPVFYFNPLKCKQLKAKIRHSHTRQRCKVFYFRDKIIVKFHEFVETVSPGQSIVFYDRNFVIGGAVIDKVLKREL